MSASLSAGPLVRAIRTHKLVHAEGGGRCTDDPITSYTFSLCSGSIQPVQAGMKLHTSSILSESMGSA